MNTQQNLRLRAYTTFAILSMCYMMLVITSAVLTNKVVRIGPAITLGGVLIVPAVFVTADILTELFGRKPAYIILQAAFILQLIFALIIHLCLSLSSPDFWKGYSSYRFVFSPVMRMSFASYICYTLSTMLNVYIINKWRILWKGRLFWLRSFGSSTIGELAYSIAIIIFMNYQYPFKVLFNMAVTSYLIKVTFSIILAFPASMLVYVMKKNLLHISEPLLSTKISNPFEGMDNKKSAK